MQHLFDTPALLRAQGADNDNLPEHEREHPIEKIVLATGAGGIHSKKDAEQLAKTIILRTADAQFGVKFVDLDFRIVLPKPDYPEDIRYTVAYTVSGAKAEVLAFEKFFA